MSWCRKGVLLLLSSAALAEQGDYLVAGGAQWDNDVTLAGSVLGDYAIADPTWLSLAVARTNVDVERSASLNTWYANLGIDHLFDPVGVRLSASYWGDNDILDSVDGRIALYWRGDGITLGGDLEYRDFEFDIPETEFFPGRDVRFDATGLGAHAIFAVSETVSLSLSGIGYDYSVNLRLDQNRPIARLLNISRLSLINSLVDYRARAGLGVKTGSSLWELDVATWEGAVDGSQTVSTTVRFLTPVSDRTDIEFGLGYDDSELYGEVVFFSVFLFFYGGS